MNIQKGVMKKRYIWVNIILASIIAGCASTSKSSRPAAATLSTPEVISVSGEGYEIQLRPLKQGHNFFVAFELTIQNRSEQAIFIDWNLSRYLFKGRPAGRVVWRGIDPVAFKNQTLPLEGIDPGATFSREIAPHKLIAMAPLRSGRVEAGKSGFSAGLLPSGENGLRLVFLKYGELLHETLTVLLKVK
jgi:hypothetical protein